MVTQARAHATRESIVRGAGQVFSDSSYSSAKLGDVIAAAGVTQGALYFHFDSKRDLALEVIRRQHAASVDAAAGQLNKSEPGLEALIQLSALLAEQITTDPVVRGGLRLSTESPELFPEFSSRPYLEWVESAATFISRAAEEGSVKQTADPQMLARFVISAFTGVQVVSLAISRWDDLRQRLEDMWTFLLPSIATNVERSELARLASIARDYRA